MITNKKIKGFLIIAFLFLFCSCANNRIEALNGVIINPTNNADLQTYISMDWDTNSMSSKVFIDAKSNGKTLERNTLSKQDFYPSIIVQAGEKILYQPIGTVFLNYFYWYDIDEKKITKETIDYWNVDAGILNLSHYSENILFETVTSHLTGEQETETSTAIVNSLCYHNKKKCVELDENSFSLNLPIIQKENNEIVVFRGVMGEKENTIKIFYYSDELKLLRTKDLYSTKEIGENIVFFHNDEIYFIDNIQGKILYINNEGICEEKLSNVEYIKEIQNIDDNRFLMVAINSEDEYILQDMKINKKTIDIEKINLNVSEKNNNGEYISIHYTNKNEGTMYLLLDNYKKLLILENKDGILEKRYEERLSHVGKLLILIN